PPAATLTCTLSLHDALPISHHLRVDNGAARRDALDCVDELADRAHPVLEQVADSPGALAPVGSEQVHRVGGGDVLGEHQHAEARDRKSTRLNSSHDQISYAV